VQEALADPPSHWIGVSEASFLNPVILVGDVVPIVNEEIGVDGVLQCLAGRVGVDRDGL
jgi:hypothetical protein